MPSKLDLLIEGIDPARTLDRVSAAVDKAVNSFSMKRGAITNWDEYDQCLVDFCRHIEHVTLKFPKKTDETDVYRTRCFNILNERYGPNGIKNAFDMVRNGKEGGLYGILKLIAEKMAEQYARNEISARVNQYVNNLTSDQLDAAVDEYLKKYGHLLPREWTEGSAVRIKIHFARILEEHPEFIRQMRSVGR
jgi:hypothetical protein